MMLRYPPFNVQAVCMDEGEEDTVRALHDDVPGGNPAGSSQKKREFVATNDG